MNDVCPKCGSPAVFISKTKTQYECGSHFYKNTAVEPVVSRYCDLLQKLNKVCKLSRALIMSIESDMEMKIPGVSDLTTTHMKRLKKEVKR